MSGKPVRMFARLAIAVLLAGTALTHTASSAGAVCTAAQIIASEPSCPAAGIICLISGQYTIENGCTLDFGGRQVTLSGNANLAVGSGSFTLRAATLSLAGRLEGIGSGAGARGGMIVVETTGDVSLGATGTVDVRGNRSGGDVFLRSGGSIAVAGKVLARDMTGLAAGGLIVIQATGNISTTADANIDAQGGIDSDGGGEIDITAGGNVTLLNDLHASGFDGGFIIIEAGASVAMKSADASGRGDAGSGGCVDLVAGTGGRVNGEINVTGATGLFMTGGCGGLVCLDGGLGEMRIAAGATVKADGAAPDGGGGQVALLSRGNIVISAPITARGPSGETCGGDLCIDAGVDVQLESNGSLDVSGGDAGGDLEIGAGRNVGISAAVDASGRQRGSLGGDITLRAGLKGRGALTSAATIDVSSADACSVENGCGQAGLVEVSGCNVMLSGTIDASGPDAGETLITSRDQLTSFAALIATRTTPEGSTGFNRIVHRSDRAPMLQTASINPPAMLVAVATCPATGPTEPPCLTPCPVCGNNIVEFPETCDLGVVPPVSCGGCSAFCRLENCNDGRFCTADSCHPSFGCVNAPTPGCQEPTATATGTPPTATATRTSSTTPSASATPTITVSGTPSLTPTASQVPTASATATASGTASLTPIASTTATTTATATRSRRRRARRSPRRRRPRPSPRPP